MKNIYKRLDIFKCVHEAHKGFASRMSVHHIVNHKKCFPNGCYYFKGSCKLFGQGKACYRGYNHIGKNCSGCRYFDDQQIFNRPELQVNDKEYADFKMELAEFEDWLEERLHREHEIHGTVDGVKPLFHKKVYSNGEGFAFSGFLLIFRQLFFGMDVMEDHVYARLSPKTYQSLKLGRGDVLSARATLTVDRGRLVLKKLKRIDIEQRGEPPQWDASKALVARETATLQENQPEGCIQCPFGALIDVEDTRYSEMKTYRQLYCLNGIPDYRDCYLYPSYADRSEKSSKLPSNSASCMTRKVNVT